MWRRRVPGLLHIPHNTLAQGYNVCEVKASTLRVLELARMRLHRVNGTNSRGFNCFEQTGLDLRKLFSDTNFLQ